jgi:biotin carboxyl carrier protein
LRTPPSWRRCCIKVERRPPRWRAAERSRAGDSTRDKINWTGIPSRIMKYDVHINGNARQVDFVPPAKGESRVSAVIDGRSVTADAVEVAPGVYSILMAGKSLELRVSGSDAARLVAARGREFKVTVNDPRSWRQGHGGKIELRGRQKLTASMPGKIVRLLATVGQQVEAGQGLLVVEAMKMQNEIRSPKSGTVESLAEEGRTVNAGEVLAVVA